MHGGMKIYAGAPAAARQYVEADRGRADDYYLTEGAGVARRFSVTEGRVTELAPLTGDAYETWVTGCDPGTGRAAGRLRGDGHAVRFVEAVVDGPKTSLAAALHPDIAQAYDAAQARAAEQIIGWLGQHATTRVGPRGGQAQVPVEVAEAVTVAHYTSRAGDPHRHLHPQINARVLAAGKWRGLHTVGVCDLLAAINGIGHAAVARDRIPGRSPPRDMPWMPTGRYGSLRNSWAPSAHGPRRSLGTSTPTSEFGPRRIPATTPARRCAAPGARERGQRAARTRCGHNPGRTSQHGGRPSPAA